MRNSTLLRFFIVSLLIAMALGVASFTTLRSINETSTTEVRRHLVLFLAQSVESGPYKETVQDSRLRAGRRMNGTSLWVLSENGDVLASNVEGPIPVPWDKLIKPGTVHEFTFHYRPFHLIPDLTLVKLEAKDSVYLLIESRSRQQSISSDLWVQLAFVFFVIVIGILIALVMISIYLRNKSREARLVLARLEKGDLKARFEIHRIDDIGRLMQDFNRMAAEIERLVHRVQETEQARKYLLEELSHDIRTPLTSLKTSIETLSEHLEVMPKKEQKEFLDISRSELTYFLNLVDDLFFIADLGEPRYKKETERVDLISILQEEIKSRQSQRKDFKWDFEAVGFGEKSGEGAILGDPLLIQRLVKNAFDNAAKHANSSIRARLENQTNGVLLSIQDDGPGISDEAIALFGQRRTQRLPVVAQKQGLSLGLGSIIMKTILELHGGSLTIEKSLGTRLNLLFPKN